MKRAAIFLLFAATVCAQPFVYYRGAVNAASFLPPGLPNGAIARGSMFSIFGRGLGPASAQQVSAFPLQPTLASVAVELTQGATKVNALPVFVSAGQLNVILPSNTPLGAVSLRVIYNGQTGNPIPITVTSTSIGLFSVNGGGFGPGIVQNFVSQASQPMNSLSATARPGQTEILWGTGIGAATFSDAVAPTAVTLDSTLELFVGGKKAVVSYAGRTPCCASIDQIVFTVPNDAPSGCYVPVVARSRGAVVSNTVTMAIHATGAPCADAHNPLANQFRTGGKTAMAQLLRDTYRVDLRVAQPYEATADVLLAAFRDHSGSDYFFNAFTALPPLGTCTTYAGATSRTLASHSPLGPPGAAIDAGSPLRVEAGSLSATASSGPGFAGSFAAVLGLQNGGAPLLFNTGPFTIIGPGSNLVSVFRAVVDRVAPPSWTNREEDTAIDRTGDMTVKWAVPAEASRGIAIGAISERTSTDSVAGFFCLAPPNAVSFTVPAYILSALPASDERERSASARLSVGNVPLSSSGSISGFSNTALGFSSWVSRTVVVR